MKKACILSVLLFLTIGLFAQNSNTEYWRDLGYKAKLKGDIESSIKNYKKVLELDNEDFDAKLAIANLYYSQQDFEESLNYYKMIYKNDTKDVEALNGFGRCYYKLGGINRSRTLRTRDGKHMADQRSRRRKPWPYCFTIGCPVRLHFHRRHF